MTHGVYSLTPTRSYAEAAEEVSQLEDALTSSDNALLALKATLVYELERLDVLAPTSNHLEDDMEAYVAEVSELDDSPLSPPEARWLAREFAGWLDPLTKIDKAVGRVSDTAPKIFGAHKARAETAAKLAESQGTGYALQIIQIARRVFHEISDPDVIAAYESALQREIFGPLRLEMPPPEMKPKDMT